LSFPRGLGVVGFLPSRLIPSPPSISCHAIVLCQSGEGGEPLVPFCSVLARTLALERMTAVVGLSGRWRAVITSPGGNPPLLLHVLRPGESLPGIGPLHEMVDFSSVALAGRIPVEVTPVVVSPSSYSLLLSPNSEAVLRATVDRFTRLADALPATLAELRHLYDMVVLASRAYHVPSLLVLLHHLIAKCQAEFEAKKQLPAPALRELSLNVQALISQSPQLR
jgi:hypothetical protein